MARVSKPTQQRRRTDMDRNVEPRFAVLVTGGELAGYVQKANVAKAIALAAMRDLVKDGLPAVIVPMQHRDGVVRMAETSR
jgi:hypothetical protein